MKSGDNFQVKNGTEVYSVKAQFDSSSITQYMEMGNLFDDVSDKDVIVCPVTFNDFPDRELGWAIKKENGWELLPDEGIDIEARLRGYNIPDLNKLLDELDECADLDDRMAVCDDILMQLTINEIDFTDFEDDVKDLAID